VSDPLHTSASDACAHANHQWCKQDQILKTKTEVTRPRPKPRPQRTRPRPIFLVSDRSCPKTDGLRPHQCYPVHFTSTFQLVPRHSSPCSPATGSYNNRHHPPHEQTADHLLAFSMGMGYVVRVVCRWPDLAALRETWCGKAKLMQFGKTSTGIAFPQSGNGWAVTTDGEYQLDQILTAAPLCHSCLQVPQHWLAIVLFRTTLPTPTINITWPSNSSCWCRARPTIFPALPPSTAVSDIPVTTF